MTAMRRSVVHAILTCFLAGCFGRENPRDLVVDIMDNPDSLESICRDSPLAQHYTVEYRGEHATLPDLIAELRGLKGIYDLIDRKPTRERDTLPTEYNITVRNDSINRLVRFHFTASDGRTWKLERISIVGAYKL